MKGYSRKEKIHIHVMNNIEEKEHFHQDIELIYILEGSMDVMVNKEKIHLCSDDILVINSAMKHSYRASENILFFKLLIEYDLISNIFNTSDIIFWCDSTRDDNEKFNELKIVLKQLMNHYFTSKRETADFGHISLCYKIMDILAVNFCVRSKDKKNLTEKDLFNERIRQINTYMHANYNQEISMKDLSDKLFLSYGYFSRFFKNNFGMSFADYLSNIRLYHAVDELLYTDSPITRVAYDNGFASVAVFNKIFKKSYGQTPSTFRKKSSADIKSEKTIENRKLLDERLEHYLIDDNTEKGYIDDNVVIQAQYSVKENSYIKPIYNMINVGSAEDLLRSEIQEHIILLKKMLGFKYVRFWSIFSEQLLLNINAEDEKYNFSRLDSILDFLVGNELKPHIELGQKPKRIYKNIQNMIIGKELEPIKVSYDKWEKIIDSLLKHIKNRYGVETIETWKIELWYDERFFDSKNSIEEYLELFNITYKVIKKYSENLEVGGCGIRADFTSILGVDFLKKWNEQRFKPDFISIIYYAYVRGDENQDEYEKRNTDNDGLVHWVKKARENLKLAGMEDTKLYVTEWNITISDRNYINDTCFKGAYIIKNAIDIYGQVDELGYFIASDRVSQYYDSGSLLHGGTGLLTKDSILKPAGFAYDFLKHILPYSVGKGDNYLVTTDNKNSYTILCHNQKKLNYNYYFINEDEIEKEHIWKYFEDRKNLELNIKLDQVENGTYKMKIYKVNQKSGSVLNMWSEMEYDNDISENDIKYLRRVCNPKLTMQKVEVKDNIMEIKADLLSNEIILIKIKK